MHADPHPEGDPFPAPTPLHELLEVAERSPRTSAAAWALSLALHGALLVSGFFVVWTVILPSEDRPPVYVSFDEPSPAPRSDSPVYSPGAAAPAAPAAPLASQSLLAPAGAAAAAPTLSDILARLDPTAQPLLQQAPQPAGPEEIVQQRRVPDVRFGGLGASNARDIVYVVDASGSMISTFPVVLAELRRSISRLTATQRFQIIFFGPSGHVAAPHPADTAGTLRNIRLIRATRDNVERVLEWAATVTPAGRSNPIPTLEIALGLRPDAVFVLSNIITGLGVWEPEKEAILQSLDQLNPAVAVASGPPRRRVAIKTIQFLDEDPAGILQAIGQTHGGKDGYKFIGREEINKR